MRTFEYIPEICKGEKYEGCVVIRMPHAADRIRWLRDMNFKISADGKFDANEDTLSLLEGMIKIVEAQIVESKIKSKDGKEISKEDIFYMLEFQQMVSEVGNLLLGGMGPSKN